MKINCLNCGKKIRVTKEDCICKYCGYYNRQSLDDTDSNDSGGNKAQAEESEFILSKVAKKRLLLVAIILVFLVQLAGVIMFFAARILQEIRAANNEVLENTSLLEDSGEFLLDGGATLKLGDAQVVDWQYGGLPDGYQLIRVAYELISTDIDIDYDTYLHVGEDYIEDMTSYYRLIALAPEEYVDSLCMGGILYMVPTEYTTGELCIYVENDRGQFERKYAVLLDWE